MWMDEAAKTIVSYSNEIRHYRATHREEMEAWKNDHRVWLDRILGRSADRSGYKPDDRG